MDASEDALPTHTPGAGDVLLRQLWGPERAPQITPDDERAVDELLARAREAITASGERAA